jgi:ribose transport system substrate-binding protein
VKRISRGPLGAIGAAAAALSLAACGYVGQAGGATNNAGSSSGTSSASNITIAGVYGNSTDPFWATLACGAKQEAATLGVKYQPFASTTLDNSALSQNFSSAQLIKPNGIFVNPANPNQFVTQYKTLMSSGVPVVTINSSSPPAQYKVVGTGTTGNSALLQQTAALVTADSGSMVVVNGIPGLVPVQVRLDPVVKAITTAHPGLTSLPTIYSGFDVNKATQAVSTDLIAHPDLKVIVAADGPDGQAAAAAVQQAGKAGKVTVIALDATPAEVTALKAGTISGLVAQSPQQIGQDQVKELVSYIQAHPNAGAVPVNVGTVNVPQNLLTKTNIDDPASSAWIYKASC